MKTKKRLYIGLLSISLLLGLMIFLAILFLAVNRQTLVYRILLVILGSFFMAVFFLIAFGIGAMVLTIYKAQAIPSLQGSIRMATNLLFPITLAIGQLVNIDRNRIKSSFIEVNNQLVYAQKMRFRPDQVMILAPHCLQQSSCPHKITLDISNCRRCGSCVIQPLRDLADAYGVPLVVATGGTLARKFIEKYHPQAIVAVACERDLTSGIIDANPLPVLGVLNERPEGPCFNTTVDINKVAEAIRFFLGESSASSGEK